MCFERCLKIAHEDSNNRFELGLLLDLNSAPSARHVRRHALALTIRKLQSLLIAWPGQSSEKKSSSLTMPTRCEPDKPGAAHPGVVELFDCILHFLQALRSAAALTPRRVSPINAIRQPKLKAT